MEGEVRVERLAAHMDARGVVFEPLEGSALSAQRNVHVVLTEPGEVRGNHWHRVGTEVLTVRGPALVRWREDGRVRDADVPAGETWRFTIPPGVPHAIRHSGDRPGLLVAFNTVAHDPAEPDVVREVLIPPS